MKKINIKNLLKKTILYRIFIVTIQILFTYLYIKDWNKSVNISIVWNALNMGLFFVFCYFFDKKNKVYDEEGKKVKTKKLKHSKDMCELCKVRKATLTGTVNTRKVKICEKCERTLNYIS